MTAVDTIEKRSGHFLALEEVERRKADFREYVLIHPNLTREEVRKSRTIDNLRGTVYGGKVEIALYDAITRRSAPNDVPAEDFRPLVSYIVSKICYRIKRSGLPVPSSEDMKQEGMIGVLKAQQKHDPKYATNQALSFFHKSISNGIWRSLAYEFAPFKIKGAPVAKMVTLCRYELSAAEARKIEKLAFSDRGYKDEFLDAGVKLCGKKNLGIKALKNVPERSEEEREDDRDMLRKDLDFLMNNLEEREKEILLARLQGQTLDTLGKSLNISGTRVNQIEMESLDQLVQNMTLLRAVQHPCGKRLYREYFEK